MSLANMSLKDAITGRRSVVDVIKVVLCYAKRLTQYAAGDGVTLRAYLRC